MKNVTYEAPTIKCEGCAETIRVALAPLPGIQDVAVDVASKRVRVDYEEGDATPDVIRQRIIEAGFPASEV